MVELKYGYNSHVGLLALAWLSKMLESTPI